MVGQKKDILFFTKVTDNVTWLLLVNTSISDVDIQYTWKLWVLQHPKWFKMFLSIVAHWGGVPLNVNALWFQAELSPDKSFWSLYPFYPEPPPLYYTVTSPDQSRLWQPLKPHTAEPVGWRGSAGPPPAGGAYTKYVHVAVEGRRSPSLDGGCHGNAHVHPCLLWKRQKWQGTSSACKWLNNHFSPYWHIESWWAGVHTQVLDVSDKCCGSLPFRCC